MYRSGADKGQPGNGGIPINFASPFLIGANTLAPTGRAFALENVQRVVEDHSVLVGIVVQCAIAVATAVGRPLQAHGEAFRRAVLDDVLQVEVTFPMLGVLTVRVVVRTIAGLSGSTLCRFRVPRE